MTLLGDKMSMLVQEPCIKPPEYCFHFCEGGTSGKNDKNMDYVCPICFDLISEAHITRCGHTFCYSCLLLFNVINLPLSFIPISVFTEGNLAPYFRN